MSESTASPPAPSGESGTDQERNGDPAHGTPDGSRRGRFFTAFTDRGVPIRTILTVDAVVILTWVSYRLIGRLRDVILLIIIAAFLALVLNPGVHFFQRRGLNRGAAIGVVFLIALVVAGALVGVFGYPLANSLIHFFNQLPSMVRQVQKGHGPVARTLQHFHLLSWVQRNAPKLESAARNLSKPALNLGTNLAKAVFSTIAALATVAFLSLFMLLEAPRLRRAALNAVPARHRTAVEDVSHKVSKSVTAYVLGTLFLSFLFGLVIFVTLVILGVPFALLIGLWVALVAMIPLVGGLIAAVPSVVVAAAHSLPAGIVTLVVFVVFQLVENHFIYPVVMSRSVKMNPLWVMLSVLIGANLGGVFGSTMGALAGALLAIPVGGAIQVIVQEVWSETSDTGAEAAEVESGVLVGAAAAFGSEGTADAVAGLQEAHNGGTGAQGGGPGRGEGEDGPEREQRETVP